mmetsp:Transcript_25955/g.65457  ORF Transcript_25955/g.65457 Transcript_25955/m.65457 type:complete len:295 (-) Transcript_25955:180-1064(-)
MLHQRVRLVPEAGQRDVRVACRVVQLLHEVLQRRVVVHHHAAERLEARPHALAALHHARLALVRHPLLRERRADHTDGQRHDDDADQHGEARHQLAPLRGGNHIAVAHRHQCHEAPPEALRDGAKGVRVAVGAQLHLAAVRKQSLPVVCLGVVDERGAQHGGEHQQEDKHDEHVDALHHAAHNHVYAADALAQLQHAQDAHEADDTDEAGVGEAAVVLVRGLPKHHRVRVHYEADVEGQDGDEVDDVERRAYFREQVGRAGQLQPVLKREQHHAGPLHHANEIVNRGRKPLHRL